MRTRTIAITCVALLSIGGTAWFLAERHEPSTGDSRSTRQPSHGTVASPGKKERPRLAAEPVAPCADGTSSTRLAETFWGMHVASPVTGRYPEVPLGAVNLTTSQVYWYNVETTPGMYDFTRLDALVAAAESRSARPMVVLGFTPAFHAEDAGSPTARTTMPDVPAWRSWVSAVARRFGDRLDYQVWPEPNIEGNWSGTPEQMARLTAVAGDIVHQEAPGALVVAPALALRLEEQRAWLRRFFASLPGGRPVADSIDIVALDPFPLEDGGPEASVALVCRAGQILGQQGIDLPVWVNEINFGVPSGGNARDVQHYPDDRQAAVVARTFLLHAATGADRVYWLGWGSYPGMAVEMERGGVPTPAAVAYSTVERWMGGGLRPTCRGREGVYTCAVGSRAVERRIYWRAAGTSAVRAPAWASRLGTVDGETRQVGAGDLVRVGGAPVMLSSGGQP